jgi:hypothetical protein
MAVTFVSSRRPQRARPGHHSTESGAKAPTRTQERRLRRLLQGLTLALSLGTGGSAAAEPDWIIRQPGDELRFTDLSFGAIFDGHHGFGMSPGVSLGIPVLDGGFIRGLNDSFFLEPGLFFAARFDDKRADYFWVIPEFGPRWNFHLTPNWDVFPAVKAGWAFGRHQEFWFRGTVGTQWWFARPWALRLETSAGTPTGANLYLGMSYQFL